MTVIAWDGKTLAADKRVTFGTAISTTTKIARINGCLVGCAGDSGLAGSLKRWVREGLVPATFPIGREGATASLLLITPEGEIRYYGTSPDPLVIESVTFSIGSGSEYADAALYLGKTAREAVEVAIALDSGCGNGIDTLTLKE